MKLPTISKIKIARHLGLSAQTLYNDNNGPCKVGIETKLLIAEYLENKILEISKFIVDLNISVERIKNKRILNKIKKNK